MKVVSPENKLYYVDIDTVRFGDSELVCVCVRFISLRVMQSWCHTVYKSENCKNIGCFD